MNVRLRLVLLWVLTKVYAFTAPQHHLLKRSSITLGARDGDLPDHLVSRIGTYLEARKNMKLPPIDLKKVNEFKERAKYGEKSLELLRPSGFYRDEDEQKAKLRDEIRKGPMGSTDRVLQMDNRMPILPHPLSFMELERHGFEDLVLPIIEYGGPHNVGVRVGIEWDDPIEEKVQVDESLRPKRVESNVFDIQGSLSLGGAFEQKMADAATIDLERVKIEAKIKKKGGTSVDITDKGVRKFNEDLIDYTTKSTKKISEEIVKSDESWSLSSKQRLFLATLCTCTSLGYGRASLSVPVQLNPIVDISQSVSLVFLAFSLLYSVLCTKRATELNKNGGLWFIKGLLGGPFTYNEMNINESSHE